MTEINYALLRKLAGRPHPLLNIAADFGAQLRETPEEWLAEVFTEARSAHHLLDMAGIPRGEGYASDLDSRTWRALDLIITLKDRLDRIEAWHSRETGAAGMVGDYCVECGTPWPCDTSRIAAGTYINPDPGT